MNKHDLIVAVQKDAGLSRDQARFVVETFFDKVSDALAIGDRWSCAACARFSARTTSPTIVAIPGPEKWWKYQQSACRSSRAGYR